MRANNHSKDQPMRPRHRTRPPTHAFPVDCATCRNRKPLELLQRYPDVSLHEELVDVDLSLLGDKSDLGPSHLDALIAASPRILASSPSSSLHNNKLEVEPSCRLHNAVKATTNFPAVGVVDVTESTTLPSHSWYHRYYRDDATHYLKDASKQRKNRGERKRPREEETGVVEERRGASGEDDDDDGHDFLMDDDAMSDDDVGESKLAADLEDPADLDHVAPSLRNTISLSMPRRRNAHSTANRLLLVPILDVKCPRTGKSKRSMVFLKEVVDRSLVEGLLRCEGIISREERRAAVDRVYLSSQLFSQQLHERNQLSSQLALHQRKLLLGRVVSASELDDETLLYQHANEMLGDFFGMEPAAHFQCQILKMNFLRSTMLDPLSGSDADVNRNDDPRCPPVVDFFEQRSIARSVHSHLTRAGLVGDVVPYQTVIVAALIQDVPLIEVDTSTNLSHDDDVETGGVHDDDVDMATRRRCAILRKRHASTAAPTCGGIPETLLTLPHTVLLPSTACHDLGGVAEAPDIAKSILFTVHAEAIDSSARRPQRCAQQGGMHEQMPSMLSRCAFCCPREEFEATMAAVALREVYQSELTLRLIECSKVRCRFASSLTSFRAVVAKIFATHRSRALMDRSIESRRAAEASAHAEILTLKHDPRFSVLLTSVGSPYRNILQSVCSTTVSRRSAAAGGVDEPQMELLQWLHVFRSFLHLPESAPLPIGLLREWMISAGESPFDCSRMITQIERDAAACDPSRMLLYGNGSGGGDDDVTADLGDPAQDEEEKMEEDDPLLVVNAHVKADRRNAL